MSPAVRSQRMKKSALWASALALSFVLGGCTVTTYGSGNSGPTPNNPGYGNSGGGYQGWQKLGERTVNGNVDHDVIYVGNDRGAYSSVMFKADNSALEVYDLVITFNDNSTYRPPMRHTFNRGQTTPALDLPGGRRYIARIDFHYRDLNGGRRGQLEAWGR
jgi:hypothetical protein